MSLNIINYIDYRSIFERVKKNHLTDFPTKDEYVEYLESIDEDTTYVDALYIHLNETNLDDFDTPNDETHDDSMLDDAIEIRTLYIEFSKHIDRSNESDSHNYEAYGFEFKIDLDDEYFVGFTYNNYS